MELVVPEAPVSSIILDVGPRKARGIESQSVNRYDSLQWGDLHGKTEFLSYLFVIVVFPQQEVHRSG